MTIMGPSAEMLNIRIPISVRLAKKEMLLYQQAMRLGHGAIVPLDKPCDEYLDILANNKLIAWGKVVVVDDKCQLPLDELRGLR